MSFPFPADIIVVFHFALILFAVLGGILSIWWRKIIWLHVRGGEAGYWGGFIEHYILHILPILYPAGLTREIQVVLGVFVIAVNLLRYWHVYKKEKRGVKSKGAQIDQKIILK
ncbi:MAG TPA: DUF2784 domain-containing protein [Syntrophaceae bacterium]|nr:DUF2784 domain-containing protein [Syntrophaceae bacterium]